MQYLNYKILHGGRFCSLDQTYSKVRKYFSGNYVIPSPKSSEGRKKEVFTKN